MRQIHLRPAQRRESAVAHQAHARATRRRQDHAAGVGKSGARSTHALELAPDALLQPRQGDIITMPHVQRRADLQRLRLLGAIELTPDGFALADKGRKPAPGRQVHPGIGTCQVLRDALASQVQLGKHRLRELVSEIGRAREFADGDGVVARVQRLLRQQSVLEVRMRIAEGG